MLYLFLRNALSTFIAGGVIGICVMATFAPLFLAGVSLNIMSLGGLALGVGMLVDNAIVVLESAARRRRESGLGPLEAAVDRRAGCRRRDHRVDADVGLRLLPDRVRGGSRALPGRSFRDLALTVVFSILVSLLVALFVIPTFLATVPRLLPQGRASKRARRFGWAGRILGARHALEWAKQRRRSLFGKLWQGALLSFAVLFVLPGRMVLGIYRVASLVLGVVVGGIARGMRAAMWPLVAVFQRGYNVIDRGYPRFLRACLAQRALVLVLAAGALVYAGWRAKQMSPDLIPESLTGEFGVKVAFSPGTPLERTASRLREAETAVRAMPQVDWVSTTVGVEADADRAADEGEHTAQMTVSLKTDARQPEVERRVRHEIDRILKRLPDTQPPEFLPSTLFRFAIPLRLVFFGGGEADLNHLSEAAERTSVELRKLEGVESVQVGLARGAREVRLEFDRVELYRAGLTAEQVAARVRSKIQGRVPTSLVEGSVRTDIRVRLQERDRSTLRDLLSLNIAGRDQDPLPLQVVLKGKPVVAEGPGEVHRVGGRHATIVTANYEGFDLGEVSDQAAAIAEPIAKQLGVDVSVAGRSAEADKSARAMMMALLLAVFLVYAVMAAQFESLLQPILIMVSLPLAGVGAIVLLDILSLPLSVVVLLGSILLVGIAVNNAIVLVDCINRRRAEFGTVREAILQAARERLRPILMTTTTTILGLLPLTGALAAIPGADILPLGLGGGEAAELRAPMAITVIGGLVTSTLLTLVVVPVLYELTAGRRKEPEAA